jgi:putative membrane protein
MKTIKMTGRICLTGIACALMYFAVAHAQNKVQLSDAEVAFVAVTANQIDIDYAALAKEKSKAAAVIKFAETMERDHKAVIAKATALANKLGVTPVENAVSRKLLSDADKTMQSLRSKNGQAFDKAYIQNEVSYHAAVIAAVEQLLIPETENMELKTLLTNIVPALKAHLMHAETLQQKYTK